MELSIVCSRCGSELDATVVPPGKVEVEPCECLREEAAPTGLDYDEVRSLRTAWGRG